MSINLNIIFSSNLEFIGGVNHQVNSDTLTVKLENIKFADGKNYFRQIAEFSVQDKYTNVVYLKPENRLYKVKNVISSEADIYSYLTHDLYAVLTKVDGKIIHAQIYYRPFISFIWFSIFLIFIPFILICFRKNNLKGDNALCLPILGKILRRQYCLSINSIFNFRILAIFANILNFKINSNKYNLSFNTKILIVKYLLIILYIILLLDNN